MATFQAPSLTFSPLPSSSKSLIKYSSKPIKSVLQFPDLAKSSPSSHRLPKARFVLDEINQLISTKRLHNNDTIHDDVAVSQMYAVLEALSDRIEMHSNIKEQRDNWASLLLNSTNMITLTATLAATLASAVGHGPSTLGLQLTSVVLFSSATGFLALMNKIQPCQLVEEQRNAVRHFKHLQTRIQNRVRSGRVTESHVADAMERVLTIDRAYPLPLLGAMLDKFPESFEPARWWPPRQQSSRRQWSEEMEGEMREIVKVVKEKDLEDYERLGSTALKISKALAVAGPALTGMAAAGAALSMPVVAGVCGALASVASTVEHGGQVGMVLEMYRNCAGFFKQLEDDVEGGVGEESEEVFELKMALRLGRSVAELRDLAARSKLRGSVDEFASKLF